LDYDTGNPNNININNNILILIIILSIILWRFIMAGGITFYLYSRSFIQGPCQNARDGEKKFGRDHIALVELFPRDNNLTASNSEQSVVAGPRPIPIPTGNNPDNDTKYQEYKEVVKEDILRVRDKVDLLIVAMHFGVE
jgi:hypothetical protein